MKIFISWSGEKAIKELLTLARHFEQRERATAGNTNKIVQAVNDLTGVN